MNELIIRILSTAEVKAHEREVTGFVSEARRKKALAFLSKENRLQSLGAGYLIKKYTVREKLFYNDYEKPLKPSWYFNVAHSGERIVFTCLDRPIGIDIEKIREARKKLIPYAFSLQQQKNIRTDEDFFKYWTLKEAIGKAEGTGLAGAPLKEIPAAEGKTLYHGKEYTCRSFLIPGYYLSVAAEGTLPEVITLKEEHLSF